nr:MAG TPA: hypothetical protein [Caudoviricetes sp.]
MPPSKAVEADTVRLCEVQILTICAKRGEPLPLAMGKARLKVRQ